MKYCMDCAKDYGDLLEICPACQRVLVLNRKPSHSNQKDFGLNLASGDLVRESKVLYSGHQDDVDYLKSVLDGHDLPSSAEKSDGGSWDLLVPPLYVSYAEELLEDIYPSIHRQETMMNMQDLDTEFRSFDVKQGFSSKDSYVSKVGALLLIAIIIGLAAYGALSLVSMFIV